MTENFAARLKQEDLVSENNFDEQLKKVNKKNTSEKANNVEIKKQINDLIGQLKIY